MFNSPLNVPNVMSHYRRDDFADGVVDEKISISDYSLSASVRAFLSFYILVCHVFHLLGCLRQGMSVHLRCNFLLCLFTSLVLLRARGDVGCYIMSQNILRKDFPSTGESFRV